MNKRYSVLTISQGWLRKVRSQLKHSIAKQKIEIRKGNDNNFTAYFADRPLDITEVIEASKPSLYNLEIQKKLDVIALANKLGNVAKAARISGCSRETIYKNRRLLKEKGPLALKRTFNRENHHKNRTAKDIEKTVISFSLNNPHLGQAQVSAQLKTKYNINLSSSAVRNIWVRENIHTNALRLFKMKSMGINC